jgi:hypothetical protein
MWSHLNGLTSKAQQLATNLLEAAAEEYEDEDEVNCVPIDGQPLYMSQLGALLDLLPCPAGCAVGLGPCSSAAAAKVSSRPLQPSHQHAHPMLT